MRRATALTVLVLAAGVVPACHDGDDDPPAGAAGAAPEPGAPSVALVRPPDGTEFIAPADIEIEAVAGDSDGFVVRVEFFQGGSPLGTDDGAPFTFRWSGVEAGVYTLSARATDNDGLQTVSPLARVTVSAAP